MNLSFAGCGFLGVYHVGVACCFRQYAPHLLLNKISGASAGAIAACCLLCNLPIGDMTSDVLRIACEARVSILGPFRPSFNVQNALLEGLEKFLPDDAHKLVSGKLHISLTRVCDGKNVIISQFDSREDLLQALLASAFVPVFSGFIPPKFHGVRYMDGGLSDNLPTLDENTITVSPFCGESDICPRDDSSQLFHINLSNTSIELSKQNMYRLVRILFPPKPEILSNMCKQGFDDALRFLHRNNLINCTRCLSVQSTFVVSETLDDADEYDPQCQECQVHRQQALIGDLPDTIMSVFQEAIESANKGIINWVFKHRGMKILSVLSLPYTVPADIVYATYTKLATAAPKMGTNVWDISRYLLEQLASVMNRRVFKQEKFNSKVNCKLAITQYSKTIGEYEPNSENQVNLDFTLNLNESDLENSAFDKVVKSRKTSVVMNHVEVGEENAFDEIRQVTAQHDAIMAYYYTDENNKVNWTEIYDMTDTECEALHSEQEKEINTQLEFDDDWNETIWPNQQNNKTVYCDDDNSLAGISDISLEELIDRNDSTIVFSDPESEWNGTVKVDIPDDISNSSSSMDLRPESDQPKCHENDSLSTTITLNQPYTIPSSVLTDM